MPGDVGLYRSGGVVPPAGIYLNGAIHLCALGGQCQLQRVGYFFHRDGVGLCHCAVCGGFGLVQRDGAHALFQGCEGEEVVVLADAHHLGVGGGIGESVSFVLHRDGGLVAHVEGRIRASESCRSEGDFLFADNVEVARDGGGVVFIVARLKGSNGDIIVGE